MKIVIFSHILTSSALVWVTECFVNPRINMRTDVTTVMAPDIQHFRGITFELAEREWIPFTVRACHDVHLYMMHHWTKFRNGSEVLIGGWGNTVSAIFAKPAGSDSVELARLKTPNIVDCLDYRKFWVSWNNNKIMVGYGNVYGKQVFMQTDRTLRPDLDHPINQIKVSSGFGATGTYKVNENIAEYLNVETDNQYGYRFVWKTVRYYNQFITFEVKACSAAHVGLTQYEGDTHNAGYEVVISGWGGRKSAIRRQLRGVNMNETEGPNMLACAAYRPFWISWHDNTIRLGQGYTYGNREVISWKDPSPRQIRAIGFSTGFGVPGTWNFFEDLEPVYNLKSTGDDRGTADWLAVPNQDSVRFYVRSAKDVHVILSPTDGFTDLATELIIGQGDGTGQVTFFRTFASSEIIKQVATPNILDNNLYIRFWISWKKNKLSFGTDHAVGVNTLLEIDAPVPKINSINFSARTPTSWKIMQNAGEQMFLSTQNNVGLRDTWMTTHQQYYKVFSMQGSTTAYVMLTRDSGVVSQSSYMVVFGDNYNREVTIKQGIWTQPDLVLTNRASAELTEVLTPTAYRTFWVGWLNNTLSVGRGWRFGQNLLTSVAEKIPHPVEALNIASDNGLSVEKQWVFWKFDSDIGDRLMVNTSGNAADIHWMRLKQDRTQMMFSLLACETTIHVTLADSYSGNPQDAYRIVVNGLKDDINTAYITKSSSSTRYNEVNSTGMLNCNDPQDFWVSWEDAYIKLGKGRIPGLNVVTSWKDSSPISVKAIGVSNGQGTAEWRYSVEDYMESSHVVQPLQTFTQTWFTSRHRQAVLLGIQSCGLFSVLLGPILGLTSEAYTYSINFNLLDGRTHTIRDGINGPIRVTTITSEPLLSCSKEVFIWIQYMQGTIMVGQGTETEKNVLLNLADVTDAEVNAIGFTSGGNIDVQVRLSHVMDDTDPFTPDRPNRKGPGLSSGAIAGIVVGVLLVVILIGGIIVMVRRGVPDTVQNAVNNVQNKISRRGGDTSNIPSRSFDNPLAGKA